MKDPEIAIEDGGTHEGAAAQPSATDTETKKGETADTVSPKNDKTAGEQASTVQSDSNTPTPPVEEITAEEIMAQHAEQAPSEENGFSLEEVVATNQVVPSNLAHAAGAGFRKPGDKEFIHVTNNPEEIRAFDILEVDDKSKYIVTPAAMAAINVLHETEGRVIIKTKRTMVYLTVNMDGAGFLWPITVTDSDNTWLESAHNCATVAKGQWIRVVSNVPASRYDYYPANKHAGEVPKWPKETFIEMLNLAFKNKVIKSLDHPAIKQLLDED